MLIQYVTLHYAVRVGRVNTYLPSFRSVSRIRQIFLRIRIIGHHLDIMDPVPDPTYRPATTK
jgi:hypothetical protein